MKSLCFLATLLWAALTAGVIVVAQAEDKTGPAPAKGNEIKIELKDFKFKPPSTVTDPDSVFVFNEDDGRLCFYTNGPAEAKFKVPTDGDWDVVISASGDVAMGVPTHNATGPKEENISPKFQLGFDGKNFGKEISLKSEEQKDYTVVVPLKSGEHVISVAFTNDTYDPDGKYDSNLYLHGVKLSPHKADDSKSHDAK